MTSSFEPLCETVIRTLLLTLRRRHPNLFAWLLTSSFRNHPVRNFIVYLPRNDFLFHQISLLSIGTAVNNFVRVLLGDSRQFFELRRSCGIEIYQSAGRRSGRRFRRFRLSLLSTPPCCAGA